MQWMGLIVVDERADLGSVLSMCSTLSLNRRHVLTTLVLTNRAAFWDAIALQLRQRSQVDRSAAMIHAVSVPA